MSKNLIIEKSISEILSDNSQYIIPIYQRNYAWGHDEIQQLLIDIADYAKNNIDKNYYIGSLVVHKKANGDYEIIDGQQRFTTLIILACYLKNDKMLGSFNFEKINLSFESRKKSDITIKTLFDSGTEKLNKSRVDNINNDIKIGYEIIETNFSIIKNHLNYLLDNVKIMRIELPQDTDLNHYFEIMNSRGEQLEKHEIIKAKLMSVFSGDDDKNSDKYISCINAIWEACSNMERYVQMGFDTILRQNIFGSHWNDFCYGKDFDYIADHFTKENTIADSNAISLNELLSSAKKTTQKYSEVDFKQNRFGSVINFPNFLLQVLKIFIHDSKNYKNSQYDLNAPLDDKRLIGTFEKYIFTGTKEEISNVKNFVFALLKTRYLLDTYVIKPDNSNTDDHWSLKYIESSGRDSKKTPNYPNSFYDKYQNHIKTLLSAMHISTPTMIYKNWLNGVLYWLYFQKEEIEGESYLEFLENFANSLVFDNYLNTNPKDYYEIIYENDGICKTKNINKIDNAKLIYGNIQNNFIFNYLDYLLWKKYKDKNDKIENHSFTFRSSVEHFYPQNPFEGKPLKDDALNSFGNLCLISHEKNSRLNNSMPLAKKENHYPNDSFDSIKQKLMLDKADKWDSDAIKEHEKEMLEVLKDALNRV